MPSRPGPRPSARSCRRARLDVEVPRAGSRDHVLRDHGHLGAAHEIGLAGDGLRGQGAHAGRDPRRSIKQMVGRTAANSAWSVAAVASMKVRSTRTRAWSNLQRKCTIRLIDGSGRRSITVLPFAFPEDFLEVLPTSIPALSDLSPILVCTWTQISHQQDPALLLVPSPCANQ